MTKIKTTRYYGELYHRENEGNYRLHFVVKVIAPLHSRASQYIGNKNHKLTDLLCLDDTVLSAIEGLTIDWSEVMNVY